MWGGGRPPSPPGLAANGKIVSFELSIVNLEVYYKADRLLSDDSILPDNSKLSTSIMKNYSISFKKQEQRCSTFSEIFSL